MEEIEENNIIKLSKSCIGKAEKTAVMRVLDEEYLGMGSEVELFELQLTNFFDRSVVCVASGTAALQLALEAAGIGSGDEVLVQSITYVASFQAISATGAKPIACDIDPTTLCLDWKDAEKRLTSKTKAVMTVHYAGGAGELDKIYAFAKKHGLRVIEDAAHAFGSEYHNKKVGSFGDISCFSFDGIKNITSGEGGCIVTDDEEVLSRVRDARLLGVIGDTQKRYKSDRSWEYNVESQGWRYHMSNIMAAIGIEQLKKFQKLSDKRKELANRYLINLSGIDSIKTILDDLDNVTPHIFPILISEEIDRVVLRNKLSNINIQTGIHYFPNHLLTFYEQTSKARLPVSESIYKRILSLPLHPDLAVSDVDFISLKLSDFIGKEHV